MNLISLRYFIAVVEAGSISQAARNSFTSQQVISDHIRRLEEHYHTRLLDRTRPVAPTPAGELLLEAARSVLATMDHLEYQLHNTSQGSAKTLTVATGRTNSPPFLISILTRFQREMPGVELTILHPNSIDITWTCPPPKADLIVGAIPFDSNIESIPLVRDPFRLVISTQLLERVLPPGAEIPTGRALPPELLRAIYETVPIRLSELDFGHKLNLPDYVADFGRASVDLVSFLCRTAQCASIFPTLFIAQEFRDAPLIRTFDLPDETGGGLLGMGFRRGERLSEATRTFIKIAKEQFSVPEFPQP